MMRKMCFLSSAFHLFCTPNTLLTGQYFVNYKQNMLNSRTDSVLTCRHLFVEITGDRAADKKLQPRPSKPWKHFGVSPPKNDILDHQHARRVSVKSIHFWFSCCFHGWGQMLTLWKAAYCSVGDFASSCSQKLRHSFTCVNRCFVWIRCEHDVQLLCCWYVTWLLACSLPSSCLLLAHEWCSPENRL